MQTAINPQIICYTAGINMTFTVDLIFRLLTLLLLGIRFLYWVITEFQSHHEKPLSKTPGTIEITKRLISMALGVFVVLQLLGFITFLPSLYNPTIQILGFILVFIAFVISIAARDTLGSNWAHAADYQIKKNHQLVTQGIYRYIRHPIYTGFILSMVGAEMVADSYTSIVFLLLLPYALYRQARMEEKILTKKFGQEYTTYMSKTKMFIPSVW